MAKHVLYRSICNFLSMSRQILLSKSLSMRRCSRTWVSDSLACIKAVTAGESQIFLLTLLCSSNQFLPCFFVVLFFHPRVRNDDCDEKGYLLSMSRVRSPRLLLFLVMHFSLCSSSISSGFSFQFPHCLVKCCSFLLDLLSF